MPMPIFASALVNIWLRLLRRREILVGRLFRRDGALRRRTDQFHRVLFVRTEIDEKFRIVDFNEELLHGDRIFER